VNLLTYRIIHDFKLRRFELGSGTVASATAHLVKLLPFAVPAGVSLELIFDLWEDQANNVKLDVSGATGHLRARPLNSPFELTDLASNADGATTLVLGTGADTNLVTCTLAADLLPTAWANYPLVRFWLDLYQAGTTNKRVKLSGDTRIVADDETGEVYDLETGDLPLSIVEVAADYTIEVTQWPGWRLFLVDATTGPVTVTLPATSAATRCRLTIARAAGSYPIQVATVGADTVNLTPGPILLPNLGSYLDLVPFAGRRWLNLNPDVVVP
jgi:hypothetical protein